MVVKVKRAVALAGALGGLKCARTRSVWSHGVDMGLHEILNFNVNTPIKPI